MIALLVVTFIQALCFFVLLGVLLTAHIPSRYESWGAVAIIVWAASLMFQICYGIW